MDPHCFSVTGPGSGTRAHKPYNILNNESEKLQEIKESTLSLKGCSFFCSRKCSYRLSKEHRQLINDEYWKMNFTARRVWLDAHIDISSKKRDYTVQKSSFIRKKTLTYKLPNILGSKIQVCKPMFLATLGLKTDGMITEFKNAKDRFKHTKISPNEDRRPGHDPVNKLNHDIIKEHINSYKPVVSHYQLLNAPNRRYLDSELSVSILHKDYLEKFPIQKVSFETYRTVFNKMNISFNRPGQDECHICYESHTVNDDHDPNCVKCALGPH